MRYALSSLTTSCQGRKLNAVKTFTVVHTFQNVSRLKLPKGNFIVQGDCLLIFSSVDPDHWLKRLVLHATLAGFKDIKAERWVDLADKNLKVDGKSIFDHAW